MIKRGKTKYLPTPVLDEVADIKAEHELSHDCEAFIKLAKYCQVGREAERLKNLNFKWRPTPPIKEKVHKKFKKNPNAKKRDGFWWR